MIEKRIHYVLGFLVFGMSLVQFLMTTQPSVSFWDPGELSAASRLLQVPHPPGAPVFLLLGRLFSLLPIGENTGFRINCVSALASAVAVLFLYLSIVKVIRRFSPGGGAFGVVGTSVAAATAALAYSFSTTFWFNGDESNVFATSTMLFSVIVWLALRWDEQANAPGHDGYLLLIAFLVGLSSGVHLMSVLAIVFVGMLFVFRKVTGNDAVCRKSAYVFLGHTVLLLIVGYFLWSGQAAQQPLEPEQDSAFDRNFLLAVVGVSVLFVIIFRKLVFTRDSFYVPVVFGGIALVTVYPGVIKLLPRFLHAVTGNSLSGGLFLFLAIMAALGWAAIWAKRRGKRYLHVGLLAMLLATLGVTAYVVIIIRAHADPPINENSPKSIATLVTYLSREQYGDWPVFKRRYSQEPHQQAIYTEYKNDFDYLWRYQMDHMFNRYLFWNFIGQVSSDQDAGVSWKQLWGIPFVMGLFGLATHFRKDWKRASALLILFIFMGYVTAYYQNQQQPQPRDRDYFYVGAFFVFALWIGIGIHGLLELIGGKVRQRALAQFAAWAVLLAAVFFIPGRMLQANYYTHDRSRNWVAWDLGYNMLQTCEKDAILFTNGDNDTFPLWYMQDVEGVRRDVRVVCLSLANTPWYIQQMKDKPYYREALPVPVSIPDSRIATLQPMAWEPRVIDIPVTSDAIARYGVTDTAVINQRKIPWRMPNTFEAGGTKAIRLQDILVRDVVFANQWKRPIYFSSTCAPDSKLGLDEYLWFQGLAWRLEPRRISRQNPAVSVDILRANLFDEPEGYLVTPHYGYKFRSIADERVFIDENASRLIMNYRLAFLRLASYYASADSTRRMGVDVLERMEKLIPRRKVLLDWPMASDVARLYHVMGRDDRFNELAAEIEPTCKELIATGRADRYSYYSPYRILLEIYETRQDHQSALALLEDVIRYFPQDSLLKERIKMHREALGK
jgi:hypothetical protein